ncbi:MAG TPA: DNA-binding domain-containing protein [Azospira sp.]|nr:DNA-binding domain-containing protein [Azospira sp.]
MNAGDFPEGFAAALLDPAPALPAGLRSWNGSDPAQRFGVHRNNVAVSLVEALADTFPVAQALVGADFFRAMAHEFVRRSPPASPVLAYYGADFPDFAAAFPPAATVPYLGDVARLEYARVLAFHAADAAPVAAVALAARLADPQALPGLCLQLSPSLRLLRSDWAIVSLWAAHQGPGRPDEALAAIDPAVAETALVVRCGLAVEVRALADGDSRFVEALLAGQALAAASAAAAAVPDFDLAAAFALLLRAQAITGIAADTGDTP